MKKRIIFLAIVMVMMSGVTAYAYWTDKVDLKLEAPMIYSVNIQVVGGGCGHKAQPKQQPAIVAPQQNVESRPDLETQQNAEPQLDQVQAPDASEEIAAGGLSELSEATEAETESAPTISEQEAGDDNSEASE
ncbi:MAG: hypothetical protein Q4D77_04465 [Peptostreptococcaceae bacterium]|nr:hypothetical protein [Peptostreptococcaceae bacterium]